MNHVDNFSLLNLVGNFLSVKFDFFFELFFPFASDCLTALVTQPLEFNKFFIFLLFQLRHIDLEIRLNSFFGLFFLILVNSQSFFSQLGKVLLNL